MKKVFLAIALASVFVACDSKKKEDEKVVPVVPVEPVKPADSPVKVIKVDSPVKVVKVDSPKKG